MYHNSLLRTYYSCRFPVGTYQLGDGVFKTRVKTQFFSPGITYTVNLVIKITYPENLRNGHRISLKYKLQGEIESSTSHLAYEREDGWWVCELYQFTSDHRTVDLQILFEGKNNHCTIEAEGIEFRPLEKMEDKDENRPLSDSDSDSDANWEDKLPTDYEDIMKWSTNSVQRTTKKEAYSYIRKGFFINDDDEERSIVSSFVFPPHMKSLLSLCTWFKGR
ncbi:hypothetical protein Hanom_Chr04g00317661 [Helianthus anomalus]